ncbi:MAG TPA: NUDIX domain-containing protein [Actinocrinis sp.]|nr:NUDIX domain-containing protein [Actinocrinis sp.]
MSLATGTAPDYVAGRFPPFAVTVDLVVLTVREGALSALLIQRGEQPHLGRSALPGGFVRIDEDLDVAARRELFEETGLVRLPVHLEQLATYGAVGRDPRMRVVSVAYLALAPDLPAPQAGGDAACAAWVPVAEVLPDLFPAQPGSADEDAPRPDGRGPGMPGSAPRASSSARPAAQSRSDVLSSAVSESTAANQPALAFDHVGILTDGVERARAKLEYSPLAAAFCPPEFTVGELRRVYEAVWGVTLDARNFHRKVTGTSGFLLPVGRATVRQGGRPAQLFQRGPATLLNPPMLRPV